MAFGLQLCLSCHTLMAQLQFDSEARKLREYRELIEAERHQIQSERDELRQQVFFFCFLLGLGLRIDCHGHLQHEARERQREAMDQQHAAIERQREAMERQKRELGALLIKTGHLRGNSATR